MKGGLGPLDDPLDEIIATADGSLLDLVDHLLNQGVVLRAEVILGLASIDLIYLQLTALLCAADRVTRPPGPPGRKPSGP